MKNILEDITLENGLSLNWKDFTGGTYIEYNGIYLTDIGRGHVEGIITIRPDLMNPVGVLHGGVIVTLADTIGIFGCGYLYEAVNITTVDLTVSFLKPVKTGTVTARGMAVSQGKSLSLWRVDEFDEKNNLIATVNVTYSVSQ